MNNMDNQKMDLGAVKEFAQHTKVLDKSEACMLKT
jgi:hypothetical protein